MPALVIDLDLFRSRVFSAGIAGGLLSYAAFFTSTLLTPFFLTRVKGLDPGALGAMQTSVPLTKDETPDSDRGSQRDPISGRSQGSTTRSAPGSLRGGIEIQMD